MKNMILLSTLLVGYTAMTFAQNSSANSTSSQSGASASAQSGTSTSSNGGTAADLPKSTVRGCLSGTSGAYMLTDASGVMYQLKDKDDESDLSANVNKEVEVMAAPSTAASASATNSPDTGTAGTSTSTTPDNSGATTNAAKTLNVTSVRKLSDNCTTQTPQQ